MSLYLYHQRHNFKHNSSKNKGIKKCNNAKHEDYYIALMYNTERTLEECRKQKVDNFMTTKKQVRLV